MDLKFQVENQKLELVESDFLVNKANNYHKVFVDFTTDDWEGYQKFIVLKNSDREAFLFHHTNDGITLPYEIVKGSRFNISVYGVNEHEDRITTDELGILLNTAGYTTDISDLPPTYHDIIADIYIELDKRVEIANIEDQLDINSSNPVMNKTITGNLNTKTDIGHHHSITDLTDFPNLANVALSGSYSDLSNKPTVISLGANVTLEKQQTADTGYFATYLLKQGGTAVGDKIQIPKDYLLKSAEIKQCTTADVPVTGYKVGDVYFDLVFNTKDSSATDTHQYLLANLLKDVYNTDNTTLEKTNNTFKVKNGGIGTNQLTTEVNTKLGYAENYNSSAAKNITTTDLIYWNGKQSVENLVTSFGSTLSDSKYPSEKLVKNYVDDLIGNIQDYING